MYSLFSPSLPLSLTGQGIFLLISRGEIHEETGLQVEIVRFVAIIRYNMNATSQDESVVLSSNFTSYLFLVKEISGELVCNDANEQISEFKEVAPEEFESIIAHLQNIKGKFEGWAQFRAVAHKVMLDFYKKSAENPPPSRF